MEPAHGRPRVCWTADDVPGRRTQLRRFHNPNGNRDALRRALWRRAGGYRTLWDVHDLPAIGGDPFAAALSRATLPVPFARRAAPGSPSHKGQKRSCRAVRALGGAPARNRCKRRHETTAKKQKTGMASIPTNTARTAPLDTTVKLGAAQQRALKDLVAMGFGKQACKEALLRTGTTSMDRLLAALTGPVEEPPVRKRDAAGTPKAVPRPRPRPTPPKRPVPTAAPKAVSYTHLTLPTKA